MRFSLLGSTGICVSRLCFGTLTMGPLQRGFASQKGAELILEAAEHGVNFVDTAELYQTYEHIKLALKHKKDMVVSTKSYSYDRETAKRSLDAALDGIERGYVDIFLLHEQESEHTLRGHYEALEYFMERKAAGEIRALGLSTHHIEALRAAEKYPEIEIVHPIFNKAGLGIIGGGIEDCCKALAPLRQAGKGVFAMKALGGGHLISERTDALAFAAEHPLVDSVAVGMQYSHEIAWNVALFSGRELPIDEGTTCERRLMIHDYCGGCGRCVARCGQNALRLEQGRAVVDAERCILCGYCAGACPDFCLKVV